jgi:hypothetical protein
LAISFFILGRLQDFGDGFGDALPVGALGFELFLSGFRELVELGTTIIV